MFEKQLEAANQLVQADNFDAARLIYQDILAHQPKNVRALYALGVVLFRGWNEARPAIQLIHQALKQNKRIPGAYNNLGKILQACRRYKAAIACYTQATSEAPGDQVCWLNLGTACRLVKNYETALAAFRQVLEIAPDNTVALLGVGGTLIDLGHYEQALVHFEKLEEIAPSDARAPYSAALAHKHLCNFSIACQKLRRAIELKSDFPEAYRGLADVLLFVGDAEGAVEASHKALLLKPDFKEAHALLFYAMQYVPNSSQVQLFKETAIWCQKFCATIPRFTSHSNDRNNQRTLRIGYVSGEFHRHPVGFFIEQVLAFHDKSQVTVFCYSNSTKTDWLTERLIKYADVWRNIIDLNDEKVSRVIRNDGIDILVDLSAHTGNNRLMVMARKPAPVQISWIGYYNTTGLDTIDYAIMDRHTVPESMAQWFTERIIYMPESRFCYTPPPLEFKVKDLPAIRNGFVTFGCFNNVAKITPQVVHVWARILLEIPDSRLILKWGSFSDNGVVARYRTLFADKGVNESRIEFRGASSYDKLMEEYGDVDIALDPFPFSGGTTTCEALWMGVPVVTLPGALPASRQSMSFFKVIGLPGFTAENEQQYVQLAVRHARDLGSLAELRQRLREMMAVSPLCDGKRFTLELEAAYREMWKRWCEGKDGQERNPITVPAIIPSLDAEGIYISSMPEATYNRGVACIAEQRWNDARRYLEQALALKPDFSEAWNNLGIVLYHLGDSQAAMLSLEKAVLLRPAFVEALNNLGKVLVSKKKPRDARRALERVLELDPTHHQALNNLGELHINSGHLSQARSCFKKALRAHPDFLDAHNNLAGLYMQYDPEKGMNCFNRLCERHPNSAEVHSNRIFAMHYCNRYSRDEIFKATRSWGDQFFNNRGSAVSFAGTYSPGRPLKVGFVSADFHQHPGGVFFQALARWHDRSRFHFFCYDNGGKSDLITDDIKRNIEEWRTVVGTTDEELVAQIQADKIDVLFDLSGFTSGQRLSVFGRKPAPVQVSWLGWFNTTGIRAIDHIIVDPVMMHPEEEQYFVEKPVSVSNGRFCYTPPFLCPDVEDLPALDAGFITFGCFNNLAKLNDEVIAAWAAILQRVPRSRLVLKSNFFRDYSVRAKFYRRFSAFGVAADRLDLRQHSAHFFMMAEYGDIDIALDPFPYTGGLTSCESLWMGVPIVTLPGQLPVSRQTAGFLKAIGLEDFIAENADDYIELACQWSSNLRELAFLRDSLRERMMNSSLCNGKQFAADFETALNDMWQRHLHAK